MGTSNFSEGKGAISNGLDVDLKEDGEAEESDDDREYANFSSMSNVMVKSWRAIESAALSIPVGENGNLQHSIGSRLGASGVDSIRARKARHLLTIASEESQLIPSPDDDVDKSPGPPPLMKWIWIALACAASYAFYNM